MTGSPIRGIQHLQELAGQEVAVSQWIDVSQQRIDAFAEATGDRQWIHVDPARAAAESPYGQTIAHGFLTLSLLSAMAAPIAVPGVRLTVNYGLSRVRFPRPVLSGTRVRARFKLRSAAWVGAALKAVWEATIECEENDERPGARPCCVAEWILLYYPE